MIPPEKPPSFRGHGLDAATLRPYAPADEDAAVELWRRTWQQAYPNIDFSIRLAWWRERWRNELVPSCTIVVAEVSASGATGEIARESQAHVELGTGEMAGFVTVDSAGYLDQIVVAPEAWGTPVAAALLDAAKRAAPTGLDLLVNKDNRRAIRFYEKHGFAVSGEEIKNVCTQPPISKVVQPDPALCSLLAERRPLFTRLYRDLKNAFKEFSR